jgi:peptidoglycan/xylan/chitin deacetylase (PgdA/CDA1 family)
VNTHPAAGKSDTFAGRSFHPLTETDLKDKGWDAPDTRRPMLIRRQDLIVLLVYCLGYSRIRNLGFRLQRKSVGRFVTFHDLLPEELRWFEANLNFLKRNTNVVGLDDFFSGRLSPMKINTVITLDDGYKSWVTDVIPVLRKLGLPATFFVSSGFIGLSKEDEAEFIRSKLFSNPRTHRKITGGLNLEDVRTIVEKGFTIGGHTLNHCNLAELRDSAQVTYEIAEDKLRLERITGTKIEYFAYPSGAYHNPEINLTEVLRESGYRGAVTTESGFNNIRSSPFLLHRELTGASMAGRVFRARVYGNYDAIRFLKQRIRMALQRR